MTTRGDGALSDALMWLHMAEMELAKRKDSVVAEHFPLGSSWKSWHDRVVKLLTVESELGYDQKKFLHDIKTRLEQYEDKTNVSNKQLSWIRFMEDRHLEQPHVEVWPDAD